MSNINSSGNMTPEQLMKLAASFGGKDAADPKSALEKLLQSPEAQRLMKKFGVDNKG